MYLTEWEAGGKWVFRLCNYSGELSPERLPTMDELAGLLYKMKRTESIRAILAHVSLVMEDMNAQELTLDIEIPNKGEGSDRKLSARFILTDPD